MSEYMARGVWHAVLIMKVETGTVMFDVGAFDTETEAQTAAEIAEDFFLDRLKAAEIGSDLLYIPYPTSGWTRQDLIAQLDECWKNEIVQKAMQ